MSNINGHIKAPLFVERDYYDIPRAARMLGVEVEDIYHWIDGIFIGLYVRIGGDFFDTDKNTPLRVWDAEPAWYCFDADFEALTQHTREIMRGEPVGEYGEYELNESPCGIWQVCPLVLNYNTYSKTLVEKRGEHIILMGEPVLDFPVCVEGYISPLSDNYDFMLAANDVRRLYNLIYQGAELGRLKGWSPVDMDNKPIQKVYNAKRRKPRTQVEHIALIDALIKSHPDIDAELLKQPSTLHKKLAELFARKGVYYPIKSARTYSRWFKEPEDK
ncbi:hypothetical protein [Vibrio parahaemolyticus]|uniref:hypothetical protein n=1 Tax=Vibrio parahaemolyticus TaxID=670 RepID=UPI000470CDF8|nr:hypothetical protein [Vibrio parahaemolyticus]MBY4654602.1 hypothetical protein [Vibrio parahaemolyticus]